MARMAIDDMFVRDPRVARLARALNVSRFDAMGRLLAVYSIAYDRISEVLEVADIDIAAELDGFADRMIEVDLAVDETPSVGRRTAGKFARDGVQPVRVVRVRGTRERLDYLRTRAEAGRAGGLKSGETRRNNAKQTSKVSFEASEARRNPPDPVPPPVPDPDLVPDRDRDPDSGASPSLSDFKQVTDRNSDAARRIAATRILAQLTKRNGVTYTSPEHFELVESRLREGYGEFELRAVIAYCADDEGWLSSDKMRGKLRPSTIFGSKFGTYIDEARSTYADEIRKAEAVGTAEVA